MDPATTEIYTLSLHDALPIFGAGALTGSLALAFRRPPPATIVRAILGGIAALGEIGRARLNSSHTVISYAVFCLKKKKTNAEMWDADKKLGTLRTAKSGYVKV